MPVPSDSSPLLKSPIIEHAIDYNNMPPIQQDSGKVDGEKIPKSVTTLTSNLNNSSPLNKNTNTEHDMEWNNILIIQQNSDRVDGDGIPKSLTTLTSDLNNSSPLNKTPIPEHDIECNSIPIIQQDIGKVNFDEIRKSHTAPSPKPGISESTVRGMDETMLNTNVTQQSGLEDSPLVIEDGDDEAQKKYQHYQFVDHLPGKFCSLMLVSY